MSEPQLEQLRMNGIPEKTRAQTEWGIRQCEKTGWLQKEMLRMEGPESNVLIKITL